MKITYGLIVYNGDFTLRQLLTSIYPHAHAICISEGTVGYFKNKGITTSSDNTNKILEEFPDPLNKIKVVHGTWDEKDNMCKSWFEFVPTDTDYIWCQDSDEIFTDENIEKVKCFLNEYQPTSLGFKSDTFWGGFDRIISGFEREWNFKRILKYENGCQYRTHRQPTLSLNGNDIVGKDINGNDLYAKTGVTMQHYSYVSGNQVKEKIEYYENAVIAKGQCIPNFFNDVWLKWVIGNDEVKKEIESKYGGCHEFKYPEARGEAYTIPFTGTHPKVIQDSMPELEHKFMEQLKMYL